MNWVTCQENWVTCQELGKMSNTYKDKLIFNVLYVYTQCCFLRVHNFYVCAKCFFLSECYIVWEIVFVFYNCTPSPLSHGLYCKTLRNRTYLFAQINTISKRIYWGFSWFLTILLTNSWCHFDFSDLTDLTGRTVTLLRKPFDWNICCHNAITFPISKLSDWFSIQSIQIYNIFMRYIVIFWFSC